MKLFSLVATLFFVTISGMEYSRHHHHPLFKNPTAFISSLTQIDQDQIKELIQMVNNLIDEGEKERDIVINSEAAGVADHDAKKQAHEDAISVTQAAQAVLVEGEKQLSSYEVLEVEANKLQQDDKSELDIAETDKNAMQTQLDDQNERINTEKTTFEEIEALIKTINEKAEMEIKKGRNLLNVVDLKALMTADPNSIQEVLDLITDLIAAGETERAGYEHQRNTAVEKFEAAEATFKKSYEDWEITLGQITRQKEDNGAYQQAIDAAKADEDAKGVSVSAAYEELLRRQAHLADENTRLDGERESCEKIIELLENIVPDQ